jgi:hypothetical protein
MGHKSFGQLGQSAYEAYRKRQLQSGSHTLATQTPTWDQLTTPAQLDWVEVAKQLWAEFAAIH